MSIISDDLWSSVVSYQPEPFPKNISLWVFVVFLGRPSESIGYSSLVNVDVLATEPVKYVYSELLNVYPVISVLLEEPCITSYKSVSSCDWSLLLSYRRLGNDVTL